MMGHSSNVHQETYGAGKDSAVIEDKRAWSDAKKRYQGDRAKTPDLPAWEDLTPAIRHAYRA